VITIDALRRAPNNFAPGSFGLIDPNIGAIHTFLNSVGYGGATNMNALNTRMNQFITDSPFTPPDTGGDGGD
jgi:hypothetical protein